MINGMQSKILCFFIGFVSLSAVFAGEPTAVTITGTADFIQRSTVTPMVLCDHRPCPKSEKYWALVIRGDDIQYELNQIFAKGSSVPPKSVELNGLEVTSGTRVLIQATITQVSEHYAIISEIRGAEYLSSEESSDQEGDLQVPLWRCESTKGEYPKLQVEVRHRGTDPFTSDYHVSILALGDKGYKQVAEIGNARLRIDGHRIRFYGAADRVEIRLDLDQSSSVFTDVPARLLFTKSISSPFLRDPIHLKQKLKCDQRAVLF